MFSLSIQRAIRATDVLSELRFDGEDSSDFTFLDEAGTAERKYTVGALERETGLAIPPLQ